MRVSPAMSMRRAGMARAQQFVEHDARDAACEIEGEGGPAQRHNDARHVHAAAARIKPLARRAHLVNGAHALGLGCSVDRGVQRQGQDRFHAGSSPARAGEWDRYERGRLRRQGAGLALSSSKTLSPRLLFR